jgi:hypothetical protein
VETASTTAEEDRAVVLRYIEEVWNRHDLDAIDGFVSLEYINHAASTAEYRHGGARHAVGWLLSVFHDHRFEVEDVAADGETVAVRGACSGTHEGELMGLAPTGSVSPSSSRTGSGWSTASWPSTGRLGTTSA